MKAGVKYKLMLHLRLKIGIYLCQQFNVVSRLWVATCFAIIMAFSM